MLQVHLFALYNFNTLRVVTLIWHWTGQMNCFFALVICSFWQSWPEEVGRLPISTQKDYCILQCKSLLGECSQTDRYFSWTAFAPSNLPLLTSTIFWVKSKHHRVWQIDSRFHHVKRPVFDVLQLKTHCSKSK